MKLISVTTRYYIVLFLAVLAGWSIAFYFIMKYEVYQNTDETLFNRANNIYEYLRTNPSVVKAQPLSDYHVQEIRQEEYHALPRQVYADTLVYEPTDAEYDEYRRLEATVDVGGRYFRITVLRPRLETTEIVNTVLLTLIPLSVLMVILLVLSAGILNKKLWSPFYSVIDFLSAYRVDKDARLPSHKHAIDEFSRLEQSINSLVARNREVFQQQKQFIENASHETQTPLAIIQSQMEILLQSPDLSEQQSEIIQSALKETDRLSKLNRTLLLISKIENQQFLEKTPVQIHELTGRLLGYFEEKKDKLNITVDLQGDERATVDTNKTLMEVMIGNLLKNAFTHNIQNGHIGIFINRDSLVIENTGMPIQEHDKIFERFYNKSGGSDNWGLGLSIVRKITEINQWKISYKWAGQKHAFTVQFT